MNPDIEKIHKKIEKQSALVETIREEIGRVIVGQNYMIDRILIGLLTWGHVLLEGVPGLAKTMTVRTLARLIRTGFHRMRGSGLPWPRGPALITNKGRRVCFGRPGFPSSAYSLITG